MQPLQQTQKLEPTQQHTSQPQQYLLAAFALFSFFNSPLTSRSSPHYPHAHTGTVLSHTHMRTSGRGMELARGGAGVPPPGVVLGVCINRGAMAPSAQGAACHSPNQCKGFCQHPYVPPLLSALHPTTILHSPKECEGLVDTPTPSNITLRCPKECEGFVHTPHQIGGTLQHEYCRARTWYAETCRPKKCVPMLIFSPHLTRRGRNARVTWYFPRTFGERRG
jgi:hypothetical protein